MSQPVIEDIGDRSDEDKEDELKESDKGGEEVANADFVNSSAVSLGQDFSENHDCHSWDDNSQIAWNDAVQEDWQSFQWEWVWEEEGRQKHMMMI